MALAYSVNGQFALGELNGAIQTQMQLLSSFNYAQSGYGYQALLVPAPGSTWGDVSVYQGGWVYLWNDPTQASPQGFYIDGPGGTNPLMRLQPGDFAFFRAASSALYLSSDSVSGGTFLQVLSFAG